MPAVCTLVIPYQVTSCISISLVTQQLLVTHQSTVLQETENTRHIVRKTTFRHVMVLQKKKKIRKRNFVCT
jgi:hypothetical protein